MTKGICTDKEKDENVSDSKGKEEGKEEREEEEKEHTELPADLRYNTKGVLQKLMS